MDLDPLTADFPSRLEQEEEEAAAEAGAVSLSEAPLVLFSPSARAALPSTTSLVIATHPTTCALLRQALTDKPMAGALILPEVSLAGNGTSPGAPSPSDAGCFLFLVEHTLVALAQFKQLPDGRTPALAQALLNALPDSISIVALGAVPAHALAGPGGAAAAAAAGGSGAVLGLESPAFSEAVPASAPPAVAPLPAGVALTGLTAAITGLAAARGGRAAAVAAVEAAAGAPPAAGLVGVAAGVASALARAGASAALVDAVKGAAPAAAAELAAADKAAARSVVYF